MSPLQQKIQQAHFVIEDALTAYPPETTLIAWSAGKDSTLVLKLVLDVCRELGLPPPRALDIDQKDQFEALTAFRDDIATKWGVEVMIVRNDDVLDKVEQIGDVVSVASLNEANRRALADIGYSEPSFPWQPDSPVCNHLLKTVPIAEALQQQAIAALYTGIRWDEHGARENETYFSARAKPPHTRVHPILHFTERDIWEATFALDIPFCELYHEGYRSLGTKSGTVKPSALPAWEQDLEHTAERDGRSEEKEKMMEQLRAWGYL